jgi:polysaccharide deacetylase family protein (PEP-CTERM system associated)
MTDTVVNALSFDIEDYFNTEAMAIAVSRSDWPSMPSRVKANTYRVLELLESRKVWATFFILGWTASQNKQLVRDIVAGGHEIACHSFLHRPVFRLTRDDFREDTQRAKHFVEDTTGVGVRGYRAPSFSMVEGTSWAMEILSELGFEYDSSVNPVAHPLYGNLNGSRMPHRHECGLWEFPIATVRLANFNFPIGGGAYFRLMPYSVMRGAWAHLNESEGKRGIFYLHPWELDPGQPRLNASFISCLRQRMNLATTESKLQRLVSEFRFAPIQDAFAVELGTRALAMAKGD